MTSSDDIQAMLDDVYATAGVPCTWTPAGGAPLAFTGLLLGGDQATRIRSMVGELNLQVRGVKARTSELAALAPGVVPRSGDALATPSGAFLAVGDPIQADPRRLEWTIDLDPAPT